VAVGRLLSYVLALAVFAAAFLVHRSLCGEPPPKQPTEPGITVAGSL
jgi:hypothetical protein